MPIIGGRTASVRGLGFQGAGAPAQVTGLSATNVGSGRAFNNGRIDLAWTAPATNGAPITGYFIERSTNSGSTWSTLVSNTGNTNVSYSDTGLTSAQRYDYRVSAINAVGTGLASNSANATATTVPQAPTIGTATAGDTNASVTFTAGATGGSAITGYTVTSSPGSITGTGSASPITVTGLTNGTAYTFTVTATNANGTSSASAASNSVTPALPSYSLAGTFNTTQNYTMPAGKSKIAAFVISGGKGGMHGYSGIREVPGIYGGDGGPGGEGGRMVAFRDYPVSAGTTISLTVGAGGTGSYSGSDGGSTTVGGVLGTNFNNTFTNVGNSYIVNAVTGATRGNGGSGYGASFAPGWGGPGSPGNSGGSAGNTSMSLTGLGTVNSSFDSRGGGGGGGGGAYGNTGGSPGGSGGGSNGNSGSGGDGGTGGPGSYNSGNWGSNANGAGAGGGGGGGGGASYDQAPSVQGSPGGGGNGSAGRIVLYVA